jgi:hypothetical protein
LKWLQNLRKKISPYGEREVVGEKISKKAKKITKIS